MIIAFIFLVHLLILLLGSRDTTLVIACLAKLGEDDLSAKSFGDCARALGATIYHW